MDVLVACERSGVVRDAFIKRGFNAVSCDTEPTEAPGPHIKADILDIYLGDFDVLIAFPPCTHLAISGARWFPNKQYEQYVAMVLFMTLDQAPCKYVAVENPVGIMNTKYRKPDQIIQPYMFGHDASKKTCLWLTNLPPLQPTQYVEPRYVDGKPRWANQTNSGQNRLGPSPTRAMDRSRTYQGIADAMAEQWGSYVRRAEPFLFAPTVDYASFP